MKKSVLIYRVGQLGDTLVALPAIQAIARRHADCRLVLLTDRHASARGFVSSWDVLGPAGWIDEVIFYEPRADNALVRLRQAVDLVLRLRRYSFSHAYNLVMRTTQRDGFRDQIAFSWLAGAHRYKGMPYLAYPPPRKLDGKLPVIEPEWSRLLAWVGSEPGERKCQLPISEAAREEVAANWPGWDDKSRWRTIVMAPGSKMAAKRWPEARFEELGGRLLKRDPGTRIVILGGAEDVALGDRLCAAWGRGGANMAGKLSIYGSAALMEGCTLYIGNDTGTMHLAAMVGLPCVAIFSARDYPGLWEPYGSSHAILRTSIDCAGCMLEACVERKMACLEAISVQEVLVASVDRLNQRSNAVSQVSDAT